MLAAGHERRVDIACLHGAQLAYPLTSTPSDLPRFLVLPPTVFQALPRTELSIVFYYTSFCGHAPELRARARALDLRRAILTLLLLGCILSGLGLIVLVSLVVLERTRRR